MPLFLAVSSLIFTCMLVVSFRIGSRVNATYGPRMMAVAEIQLEVTVAHLWFEEMLSGDRQVKMDEVWEHLDRADRLIDVVLCGGELEALVFVPLEDAGLRQELGEVRGRLARLTEQTRQRLVEGRSARTGSAADQRYDSAYGEFIRQAGQVEEGLRALLVGDQHRFRAMQRGLVVGCVALFLIVNVAFYRHERRRRRDFATIEGIGRELEREIGERERAEQALRESELKFRQIVQASPMGIHMYWLEEDGRLIFTGANPTADAILGVDNGQFVGKSIEEAFPPLAQTEVPDSYRRVCRTGESWETELIDYEDEQIRGAFEVHAFQTAPGAMATLFLDITARKQAEQEREELIAELEAKNAELERFTYTVSHDLKNPLITIKGFLGMVLEDLRAGEKEQMEADIERIGRAADTMRQLLDDLLELSRIGRVVNDPTEVSLSELAHRAAETVRGRLDERGVKVEIEEGMPLVRVDAPHLQEALENLLDNAAKYMGEQAQPRIAVGCRWDGGERVYFVRDNGMGIDSRFHDKIFQLFDKLDQDSEGTGVGLAIVKRIIESQGGRIWVESEGAGRGSTFCFTLPQSNEDIEGGGSGS